MRIGFIGTGHITAAMVEGLCTSSRPPERIVVSPRGRDTAAALSARFAQVRIGEHNQAVVDACETVVLALRPELTEAALSALSFSATHTVLSVIATVPLARLQTLVRPARSVGRGVPLPSVARHLGPIAYFPEQPRARELWSLLGTAIPAAGEQEFHALWALTALLSPYYALLEEVAGWCERRGVARESAERYVASLFHAITAGVRENPSGIPALAAQAATPGGLNAQAIRMLRESDAYAPFLAALDGVLLRMSDAV